MNKIRSSPYGPDYQESKEIEEMKKYQDAETNQLLKEIIVELKNLSSAINVIAKNVEIYK
ncbi:hypothetical protein [uncultured Clostridium sp.]|uniref:hypothetical protein n=1 Tax=uncultured Clostridium sp. TaxID=59620 RepID=UPI0028E34B7F|nr:hypothetical protein [uncultured Clostridium sp.]